MLPPQIQAPPMANPMQAQVAAGNAASNPVAMGAGAMPPPPMVHPPSPANPAMPAGNSPIAAPATPFGAAAPGMAAGYAQRANPGMQRF